MKKQTNIYLAYLPILDLKSFSEFKKCLMNTSNALEPAHTFQQKLIVRVSS